MRVLVTRPAGQAPTWVDALCAAGLQARTLPLIEVASASREAIAQAWQRLGSFDAVMFVSANAIQHFFAGKPPGVLTGSEGRPRYWVTGPGSRDALLAQGVTPERIDCPAPEAAQFDSEALWQVVGATVRFGSKVLIVRGTTQGAAVVEPGDRSAAGAGDAEKLGDGVGRDWFSAKVQAAGGQVEFVVSYARRPPALTADQTELIQQAAADGTVWLFTSSEAIGNLLAIAPTQSWALARCIATHARIADAATKAGFGVVCLSRPSLEALVASIKSLP